MHPLMLTAVPLGLAIALMQLTPAVPAAPAPDHAASHAVDFTRYADAAALKCGRFAAPELRYVVDASFVDESPSRLDQQAIDRIEILCWDREAQVLQRGEGDPVIYVTTHAFRKTLLGTLQGLPRIQQAFRAEHGRFASEFDELRAVGAADAPAGIDVALNPVSDGWQAVATGALFIERCTVSHETSAPDCALLERFLR